IRYGVKPPYASPVYELKRVDTLQACKRSSVELRGREVRPIVFGKELRPLTDAEFNILTSLIGVFPDGMSGSELATKSGHPDAVRTLKKLKNKAGWTKAIATPGRYRTDSYR